MPDHDHHRRAPRLDTLLDRAWAAVPEVAALAAALPDLQARYRATMSSVVADADAVLDEAFAAVLAGHPLPDDLGEQVRTRRQELEHRQTLLQVLMQLQERMKERTKQLRASRADAALAVVRAELEQLLAEARPVLQILEGIDDAQGAIDAGGDALTAWRQVGGLVARYEEVRQAQRAIVTSAITPPDEIRESATTVRARPRQLVDTFGLVENYAELVESLPGERDERDTTVSSLRTRGQGIEINTSAVTFVNGSLLFPAGDTLAELRYLTSPDARPWVPSVRVLLNAEQAARQPVKQ